MEPLIGIDLGTTYSALARINDAGKPEIVPNAEGKRITPSVVYVGGAAPLVGEEAKEKQAEGEGSVASFFKRSMGDANFLFPGAGRDWTPTQLSAEVLKKLKKDAEARLGVTISKAVITVPAYFGDGPRSATIEAGRLAGLEVRRIISEPTAAALAYGLHKTAQGEVVLVYDLGGGTFDVTLVRLSPQDIRVLATDGDHNLGGKDWDDCIANFLGAAFAEKHGVNPLESPVSFNDLLVRTEKAKIELSKREATRVALNHEGASDSFDITRAEFAELTRHLMERTERLCDQVLKDAGLKWTDLTGVLLVGGSTHMPMVHEYVARMANKPPMTGVNVDEAVALGAAVQAGLEQGDAPAGGGQKFLLGGVRPVFDVTAHSLGVIAEAEDRQRFLNSRIIERNSQLPASGQRDYQANVRQGAVELNVYVTEGESENPRHVSIRSKYVCRGPATASGSLAPVQVEYTYDKNAVIQVRAREVGGKDLTVASEPVSDLSWLDKSPMALERFDPSALTLITTPPHWDDIGKILKGLNLPFVEHRQGQALRGNILFLNCGTSAPPDSGALRAFVEGGGCLYASDYTDSLVGQTFPGPVEFAGHRGERGHHRAEIVDPELINKVGKRELMVNFDTGAWATIGGMSRETKVLMRSAQTGEPLMVTFPFGQGTVFFTCFHNHAQASEDEQRLLQNLVFKQISVASGVPIEVVSRGRGLMAKL